MRLAGMTSTPWPGNTQGPCLTAKSKVLGEPNRKREKRPGIGSQDLPEGCGLPLTALRGRAIRPGLAQTMWQVGGPQHCACTLRAPSLPTPTMGPVGRAHQSSEGEAGGERGAAVWGQWGVATLLSSPAPLFLRPSGPATHPELEILGTRLTALSPVSHPVGPKFF